MMTQQERERLCLDAVVARVLAELAGTGSGGRGAAAYDAAKDLGKFVGSGHLAETEAERLLFEAACGTGLPATEAREHVRSGLRKGAKKPWPGLAEDRAQKPLPPPQKEKPKRIDPAELEAVWSRAQPLSSDPAAVRYCERRTFSVEEFERADLFRVLPEGCELPRWAWGKKWGRWSESGYRLLCRQFDARGRLAGLRARSLLEGLPEGWPKAVAPTGASVRGLVMADEGGQRLLRGELEVVSPAIRRLEDGTEEFCGPVVLVVEGESDLAAWETLRPQLEDGPKAVFGLVSGSWSEGLAARVPEGSCLYVRTDLDSAGHSYAGRVAQMTDRERVLLLRKQAVPGEDGAEVLEGDEADLLAAGALERSYRYPAEWAGRGDRAERPDQVFHVCEEEPTRPPMRLGATAPRMTAEMLPAIPACYARAISAETGTPLEWAVAGLLVSFGTAIMRSLGVRPDAEREWVLPTVFWGAIVGEPGTTKSAVIAACRRLLEEPEADALEDYQKRYADYQRAHEDWEQRRKVWVDRRLKLLRKDHRAEVPEFDLPEPEKPTRPRLVFGDFTQEAVVAALAQDCRGAAISPDELKGVLAQFGRKGQETQRTFLLTGWSGLPWTVDRKGDGTTRLERLLLAMFGSIQPDVLRAFLDSSRTLEGNDGFFERLQLLVWPDELTIEEEDQLRAQARPGALRGARERALKLIRKILELDPVEVGAEMAEMPGGGGEIGVLGFTEEAQWRLDEWQEVRRRRQKAADKRDPMRAHLGKFQGLAPALALVCHLTETDDLPRGPIGLEATEKALRLADVFEANARKVYSNQAKPYQHPAWVLGRLIAERKLPPKGEAGFTERDVRRLEAAGLRRPAEVQKALVDLVGLGWIEVELGWSKGRMFTRYKVRAGADHRLLDLPGVELDWKRVEA